MLTKYTIVAFKMSILLLFLLAISTQWCREYIMKKECFSNTKGLHAARDLHLYNYLKNLYLLILEEVLLERSSVSFSLSRGRRVESLTVRLPNVRVTSVIKLLHTILRLLLLSPRIKSAMWLPPGKRPRVA